MDDKNDDLGFAFGLAVLLIVLCVIAVYFFTSCKVNPLVAVGVPAANTARRIAGHRKTPREYNKNKTKPLKTLDIKGKLKTASAPLIGLGLGYLTNMLGIAVASSMIPIFGVVIGGMLGVVSGVFADFIPHCIQEFYHCAINHSFPKAKTRFGRIAKFLRGPLIGCSTSFLTNGLAIGISNFAGDAVGALTGALADVIPHTIQEIHAQRRDKKNVHLSNNDQPKEKPCNIKDRPQLRECLRCILHRVRHDTAYTPPCRKNIIKDR